MNCLYNSKIKLLTPGHHCTIRIYVTWKICWRFDNSVYIWSPIPNFRNKYSWDFWNRFSCFDKLVAVNYSARRQSGLPSVVLNYLFTISLFQSKLGMSSRTLLEYGLHYCSNIQCLVNLMFSLKLSRLL